MKRTRVPREMIRSRLMRTITSQTGTGPRIERETKEEIERSLSARGSRKEPSALTVSVRRAMYPSRKSVPAAR